MGLLGRQEWVMDGPGGGQEGQGRGDSNGLA